MRLPPASPLFSLHDALPISQVLIVGAGPVGLTLAIDLGKRGIHCILVEQKEAPQFLPKMERCNARTMEIFRRLGLAEKIRVADRKSTRLNSSHMSISYAVFC